MLAHLRSFMNEKYIVLHTFYTHELRVGEEVYVPISQEELASLVGISRPKVSQIIQDLLEDGYIATYRAKRGKYQITEKGYSVIYSFESLKAKPGTKTKKS